MKRFGVLIGVTVTLIVVLAAGRPAEQPQLRVRVTSSDPNQELLFAAAYVFDDASSELETLETMTPVEFERSADVFAGIFCQKSDGAVLEVRVLKEHRGKWREVVMGDGTVIVVTEHYGNTRVTSW